MERSPTVRTLERDVIVNMAMSFVGGFVDAAGYIALWGLFTAHVTGNFVLIGAELISTSTGVLAKSLALPVFVLAVTLARLISRAWQRRGRSPLSVLFGLEALCLVGFLVFGLAFGPLASPDSAPAILSGMSAVAAMGLQNGIGRVALAHLPATTVMTVNVAQSVIDAVDLLVGMKAAEAKPAKERLMRMAPAILAFALGAFAGAFGVAHFSFACAAVPALILVVLATALRRKPTPVV